MVGNYFVMLLNTITLKITDDPEETKVVLKAAGEVMTTENKEANAEESKTENVEDSSLEPFKPIFKYDRSCPLCGDNCADICEKYEQSIMCKCGGVGEYVCDFCDQVLCPTHTSTKVSAGSPLGDNICPDCSYTDWEAESKGRVRTLSGKPHRARKMKKDKDISPEEAKSRHSFSATKGIDTYAEPFEEIGDFYGGKKGILKIVGLAVLVGTSIWITKNRLLE